MDYRDRLYKDYASGHTAHLYGEASLARIRAQYPVWQEYFGAWLPADKAARVLDIGCGNGDFVHWLQEAGYTRAEGIDRSPEQIELGKRLGVEGLNEASIEEFLPQHADEYDLITARDVLEHFRKDELLPLLDQVHAALAPGGSFVAQTANAENWLWGRLRYGDFTHETVFTKNSIRQILLATGFREIEVLPQRPVVHGVVSAARAFLWWLGEWQMRIYLLIETGSWDGIFTQNLLIRAKK